MSSGERSVHILVTGRVQGVGYRYFAQAQAEALGVRGYVRNLPDGRVEAVAVGRAAPLEQFVQALRAGPPGACVQACQVTPLAEAGVFDQFTIRR